MHSDKNVWIGTVHIGADSELRYTGSGKPVLNFRGACTQRWRDDHGEEKEQTSWINFVIWGPRAETLHPMLIKGKFLLIEGELRISNYEDKDGNRRLNVAINVDDLMFIGGRRDDDGRGHQDTSAGQTARGGATANGGAGARQAHAAKIPPTQLAATGRQAPAENPVEDYDGEYGGNNDEDDLAF